LLLLLLLSEEGRDVNDVALGWVMTLSLFLVVGASPPLVEDLLATADEAAATGLADGFLEKKENKFF
jgi:hypothetical protein